MYDWDVFAVVDRPLSGVEHQALPESGWGAVLAWAAGPDRVVRSAASPDDAPPVRIEEIRDGTTSHRERPRSPADQELVDDLIDEYLEEAGIPPRPRGFSWFLVRSAAGVDLDDLHGAAQEHIDRLGLRGDPAHVLDACKAVLSTP